MFHHFLHQSVDIQNPTLKLFQDTTLFGVDNLNPLLTINGVTAAPMFRYKGGDASAGGWNAWGYGSALALQAPSSVTGNVPTYNQGSPLLGPNDDSVKFNEGSYFNCSDNTVGDVATEDIVIEIVFKSVLSYATYHLCSKYIGSAKGWSIYKNATTNPLAMTITDATGTATISTATSSILNNTWYHAMCFINRDEASTNGSFWYLNGVVNGVGVNCSSRAATITSTSKLAIGARSDGTLLTEDSVAYVAMWKQANWHQAGAAGPAEWANVAKERFMRMAGFWPAKAEGTSLYTFTRASIAALDKVESGVRKLYYVGANWPRLVSRNDANGNNIKGYLSEIPFYNNLYLSEDFITGWSCINIGEDANNRAVDGDMEAAGVTNWTVVAAATLTKTGTPHGGLRCLRIARSTTTNPGARQSTLLIGSKYRIIGYARSDGFASPALNGGGLRQWTGTTSTGWQAIDVTFYSCAANYFDLYSLTSTGTQYTEWDDIIVHELFPLDDFSNKIVDGYMEAAGIASWTAQNNAALTKETTTPYEGTQVLRVARNGINNPSASQNILVNGCNYRLTGWCRGDGTAVPQIWMGGVLIWVGTTSVLWQSISILGGYGSDGLVKLGSNATVNGKYVDYDYIRVSQLYSSPDKQNMAVGLIADVTDTQHGVYRQASGNFCPAWSVFAKKGDKDWLYFYFEFSWGDVARTGWCYFNLSTGVVGTKSANPDVRCPIYTYMEDWGDGWYRCVCMTIGSTANLPFKIQPALSDGDLTFAGDGTTINTYIWGAQIQYHYAAYPSAVAYMQRTAKVNSYMPVLTNVGVLKAADVLYYKGDDGNIGTRLEGAMSADFMIEGVVPNGTMPSLVNVNKDGSNATSAILKVFDTAEALQFYNGVSGSSNTVDGIIRKKALGTWSSDEISASLDGKLLEKKP